jgi:hypothetical protein
MSNALETGHYEVSAYENAAGWHYRLNDGLLAVGPFASKHEAVTAAFRSVWKYKRVMGGRVVWIAYRGE